MKVALFIEEGREQIILTPETDLERTLLGKMTDASRVMAVKSGSFYQCRGGWTRQSSIGSTAYGGELELNSTMIVLDAPAPASQDKGTSS